MNEKCVYTSAPKLRMDHHVISIHGITATELTPSLAPHFATKEACMSRLQNDSMILIQAKFPVNTEKNKRFSIIDELNQFFIFFFLEFSKINVECVKTKIKCSPA